MSRGVSGYFTARVIKRNGYLGLKASVSVLAAAVMALCVVSLQGRALLARLHGLKAKGIQLKISSGMIDSAELETLAKHCQHSLRSVTPFQLCLPACTVPFTAV